MDHNVPLKQVAFTPVVPHNINNGEVAYMEMNNIKPLRSKLVQLYIPLYANEKVYSIVEMIQLRFDLGDVQHCEKLAEVLWQKTRRKWCRTCMA